MGWWCRCRPSRSEMARGGCLVATLALSLAVGSAAAQDIVSARYTDPTDRYPHGALGDEGEWDRLEVTVRAERVIGDPDAPLFRGTRDLTFEFVLPPSLVWEDTAPRLWDVTGDGRPEIVAVQSHQDLGARLLVLGLVDGQPDFLAATEFIGTRFRWLAPVGTADLTGDGFTEIAYIDRPHLAQVLRIVSLRPEDDGWALVEIAQRAGLSNHRFGAPLIEGGIADCGAGPVILTADAGFQQVMETRLVDGQLVVREIGPYAGPDSVTCPALP